MPGKRVASMDLPVPGGPSIRKVYPIVLRTHFPSANKADDTDKPKAKSIFIHSDVNRHSAER